MKKTITMLLAIALLQWPLAHTSVAQDQENESEDVYELNPFNVDESQDMGYLATNTLSGTRLNASLKDTAASVSVWTQEFLDDTGLVEIDELIRYSLNSVLDTDNMDGPNPNFTTWFNAVYTTQRIRTRGVDATRGLDYFKTIVPDDAYKIGRYDDARGPNGVLFGVSNAGGLINQSSLFANTYDDSGRIRYSFGDFSRNRAEFRYNKVLAEDKFAILVAGLKQDNGHWRDWASHDKERIYLTATYKPIERITIRANFEDGSEHKTLVQPSPMSDYGLPYYDNLLVLGLENVLFEPTGGNPSSAMREVGVTNRNGNPRNFASNGQNRFTYIANDGTFYNATGEFQTRGYDDERVRHPDGSPGLGDRFIRINDPEFLPYHLNPAGDDMYREDDFNLYSLFLDVELAENWFFNVQAGHQETDLDVFMITGNRPRFQADPNTTQGLNGPVNPYAGRFYLDAGYRNDRKDVSYDELRVSTSYDLETEKLGRHRIALSASKVEEEEFRVFPQLALGGNPAGRGTYTDPNGFVHQNISHEHGDNRITIRHYIDLNDTSTWRIGRWRDIPSTVQTDRWSPGSPQSYPVTWVEGNPGRTNYLIDTAFDSAMVVTQSHFFDDRFVVTLGLREDEVSIERFGHRLDPLFSFVPDRSITWETPSEQGISPGTPPAETSQTVKTAGAVFHINENISLVANAATNIGVPDLRTTVFPDATSAPPPEGDGLDIGIDFSALDNRLSGRLVYYETDRLGDVPGGAGNPVAGDMADVYEAYEDAFTPAVDDDGNEISGTGNPTALNDLLNRRQELNPAVTGYMRDFTAKGWELRITANITYNWRFILNASHTDRIIANTYNRTIEFLGLQQGSDGLVVQGATEVGEVPDPSDPGSTIEGYAIDPSAYSPDGVIAEYLALESQLPATLTLDNTGISRSIFDMADAVNERKLRDEKRWGLRPYRVNLYTAYDFDEGYLDGWSAGFGYRWESANIMGENSNGEEIEGESMRYADLMLRYRIKQSFFGNGRWTFQMNINNLFDNRDILPSRLSIDDYDGWEIPGGRGGPPYARFDLPTPREIRFSATLDF